MNIKKKIVAVVTALTLSVSLVSPVFGATAEELAASIAALQAQLTALQAQLAALQAAPAAGIPAACSGITFDRNLKLGMSGNDVKCLQALLNQSADTQVAATGAGSPGNETTYFGALTKAAVVKFQEKYRTEILDPIAPGFAPTGYVGAKTRVKLNALLVVAPPAAVCGNGTCETGETTATCPADCPAAVVCGNGVCETGETTATCPADCPAAVLGLTASLDPSSPASSVLVVGQGLAKLASFKFTGTGTITGVTLKRIGVSADTTLSNVYLFEGSTRLTDAASVSSGSLITITGLSLAVSGSRTIDVKATLAGTAGEMVGVQLTAVTVSEGTVSGLPVSGALHSLASATLATVAVGTPLPSSAATTDPENDVRVWESTFTISNRDVTFTRLALRQINSIPSADIKNFRLLVDGVQVAQADSLDANKYVTFAFSKTLTTGSRVVKVLADVTGGSSYKIQMSLRNAADIELTDSQYGVAVSPTGTPASTDEITVNAGTMVVEKATDSPTGNVTNNASDVTLGKWTFTAYGEPIKVETLTVGIDVSGTDANQTLRNGRIMVDGSQVGSTTHVACADAYASGQEFTTNFTVKPGSPASVEFRADIFDNEGTNDIASNSTIQVSFLTGSSNAERTVSMGRINVPSSAAATHQANRLVVAEGTITLAQDTNYTNQSTVVPQTAYKLADFNLTNTNNVEDINLNTISVDFSAVTGTTFTSVDLSNVYLKYGDKTTTVKSSVSATSNSWSITYTLAKNASIPVEIYASIGSGITATHSIKATTTITGTTALSGQSKNTGAVDGQTITAAAGSFTATTDATTPSARIVADNQTIDAAAFKLAAVNDKYSLSQVVLTIANASAVKNVTLKDGATVLATLPGATTVTFNLPSSGTGSFSVNANASKVLTVALELGTVGVGGGTSGASLLVTLSSGKAIAASNGVEADISLGTTHAGNAVYVYASIPTITNVTLPTSTLSTGTVTLAKFSVSSGGTGTIGWNKIIFSVTKTATPVIASPTLWDADSSIQITGTATVSPTLDGTQTSGTISFVPAAELEISGAKTYVLKATVSGSLAVGDNINTNIAQPVNAYAAPAASATVVTTGASFVWTDQSASSHGTGTSDWNNEYLVKNLPTDSQTLYK